MISTHINVKQAKVLKLKNKKCNCCGKKYPSIDHYTIQSEMVWFDCDCKSTLVVMIDDVKNQLKGA